MSGTLEGQSSEADLGTTVAGDPAHGQVTVSTYVRGYLLRLRSGDLGSLPIIVGIVIIAIVFQALNPAFLTPRNFVNLMIQMAGLTTIAIGVVFVLLTAQIDLSVSYVSAISAVILARLMVGADPWHWAPAVLVALAAAAAIGFLHGTIITKVGIPSFIVTLAGFLVWNGMVLILIGGIGTIRIRDAAIIGLTNAFLPPLWGWLAVFALIGVFVTRQLLPRTARKRHGLAVEPLWLPLSRIGSLTVLGAFAVAVANASRGVPVIAPFVIGLLIVFSLIASRTAFGRYVYAVGGSLDAARRAGINVDRIRTMVFVIASLLAGIGGIILASRLNSVDPGAGGGNLLFNAIGAAVIGGTSLFGGHGRVVSALLGALIIASVDNGMGLLGMSSGAKFVVTGLVLLLAVILDSLSRRSRTASGLA